MKYNLERSYDVQRANEYLSKLTKDKVCIELKKVVRKRTNLQNSYLHVLFSLWGDKFGLYLSEAKQTVKEELGYTYTKKGRVFLMQTSIMDTKQLTVFIDKFRDWSSIECKHYLPSPEEYYLDQIRIDNEIEIYKNLDYTQKQ